MPRDGSGVYSKPAGTTASPNTTIESSKYNAFGDDLVTDLNAARPITAGGTGETTARLADGTWRFKNTDDPTKLLAFDLSGLTTATTRTLTVPNASGTLVVGANVVVQTFTATGTYTPTARMHHCIVEAVGGGGGGGGAKAASGAGAGGAGGGAGSYSRSVLTAAQIGASKAVTIGAAGAAGTSTPGAGGNGGDTSLTTLVTASGGSGGAVGTNTSAGAPGGGGAVGTADVAAPGAGGGHGFSAGIGTVNPHSGAGASGPFGAGGVARVVNNTGATAGAAGAGNGAGGSGGCEFNQAVGAAGGAGTAGYLIVTEFIG